MPTPHPAAVLALAAMAALAGCSTTETYPSLALRPIEEVSLAEPPARAIAAGTPAAAADTRYAAQVAQARAGDAAFRRVLDEARPVLERGRTAAVGSDAWGAAQTRLSRVQSARAPVTQALLALQAASEAPETRTDSGLSAAAARALEVVAAIDREETGALAAVTPVNS